MDVPSDIAPAVDVSVPEISRSFYRRIDWLAFLLTTLFVFAGYWLTLAPDVTLEDSGELAVGSFYAGVPHPPGYPFWTLYSWLFTRMLPFSNIAWRVAVSSAVAGSLACGFLALLVSRMSSLMVEGIFTDAASPERKADSMLTPGWGNRLSLICGFAAGAVFGFSGFMWSQSVIVEVYPISVLSLVGVLCCLFRWAYRPQQWRYLYLAFFIFGICFTNHQTLVVAAMGLEIAVLAVDAELGRDLFAANVMVYIVGLIGKSTGLIHSFDANLPLFIIFNAIGMGSAVVAGWQVTRIGKIFTRWNIVLGMLGCWLLGASFYLYMPIASMSNPPMNWGYARTVEGFIHAFTRGQYPATNPTHDLFRFFGQLYGYWEGATEEFNAVNILVAVVPFLFIRKMARRDRAWMIGLSAVFFCLAVLLMILLNPENDRLSRQMNKVFFTASHLVLAVWVGCGLAILFTWLARRYEEGRTWALYAAAVVAGIALYGVAGQQLQYPLARYTAYFGLGLALMLMALLFISKARAPLAGLLMLTALLPLHSILLHCSDNEQRGHLFGFWFGHDMFTPPFGIYPEMSRDAILFGGSDAGRFNPTYMIFCESFIPPEKRRDPKFDRRDVYIITQNALADNTYLNYIRAHYFRSHQEDPAFFTNFFHTSLLAPLDRTFTDLGSKIEKERRERGVYPPSEIYIPSDMDLAQAFAGYRQALKQRDPKRAATPLRGGDAVMAIDGFMTQVIFNQNSNHEFYVEESFPIEWMGPYLTPHGIIMKINRNPVQHLGDEVLQKDHEFWSRYSDRLIGNWITYNTTTKELCDFVRRVHERRDFRQFKGDPKFVRDDVAQSRFAALRSSLAASVYFWRLQRTQDREEQTKLVREAEFAFRQAYAFQPYNLQMLPRYLTLLAGLGRLNEGLELLGPALELDPGNPKLLLLSDQIKTIQRNEIRKK